MSSSPYYRFCLIALWMLCAAINAFAVPLTGSYSIGALASDYPSFSAAVSALSTSGVGTGGVVFSVRTGIYREHVTIPPIPNASQMNQIVFQKELGPVEIRYTGTSGTSDAVVTLMGSDWITFDGIDVRDGGDNSLNYTEFGYYLQGASATDGVSHNRIQNCSIILNRVNSYSRGIYSEHTVSPSSPEGGNSYNAVLNIVISNAFYGIYLKGSNTNYDIGNEIGSSIAGLTNTNRTFIGSGGTDDIGGSSVVVQVPAGVQCQYQSELNIHDLDIGNVTSTTNFAAGISIQNASGNVTISGNRIFNIRHNSTTTANYGAYGINVSASTQATTKIFNNIVDNLNTSRTVETASVLLQGISVNTGTVYLDNNTIYLSPLTIGASNCCLMLQGGNLAIRNNILFNGTLPQTTAKHYAILYNAGTLAPSSNNLFSCTLNGNGFVGRSSNVDRMYLMDWSNATGQDLNSSFANPQFINPSTNDFHIQATTSSNAMFRAVPVPWVGQDIDAEARNLNTPAIGADEPLALQLIRPNGLEVFTIGNPDSIQFKMSGQTPVRIELNRNYPSSTWEILTAGVPNNSMQWIWSSVYGPSTNLARVRVVSLSNPAVGDTCDNNFSIIGTARLQLSRPNGNEVFVIGQSDTTRWIAEYVSGLVRIELNRNYPNDVWEILDSNTELTQQFWVWNPVGGMPSSTARIRLTAIQNSTISAISENDFTLMPPMLQLFQPNGGEYLPIGQQWTIGWMSNLPGFYRLQLNRNFPAGTWEIIQDNLQNVGSTVWNVSGAATTNARFRLLSITYPALGDTSDGDFSIVQPYISILSPIGGEILPINQIATINWAGRYFSGNVHILLNRTYPLNNWDTLFANIPNNGSIDWVVSGPSSVLGRIKILSVDNPSINATNGNNFTILSTSLNVTPNSIDFGNQAVKTIDSSLIAIYQPNGLGFSYHSISGGNSGSFSSRIVNRDTMILGSDSLQIWVRFKPDTVLTYQDTVRIECNAPYGSIAIPISGNGIGYYLTVYPDIAQFPGYTAPGNTGIQSLIVQHSGNRPLLNGHWININGPFRVTPNEIQQLLEGSANTFNLLFEPLAPGFYYGAVALVSNAINGDTLVIPCRGISPSINLTSHNVSDTLVVGFPDTIRWTSQFLGETVRIEINRNFPSENWSTIVDNLENTGQAVWYVSEPSSNTVRFRISCSTNPTIFDLSDTNSTIITPLKILHPIASDLWRINALDTILWQPTGISGTVRIDLNRNYPTGSWETIVVSVPNDGQFLWWHVTGPATSTARIRISSNESAGIASLSPGTFQIYAPLQHPNGGETLLVGTPDSVRWQYTDITGTLTIKLNRYFPRGTWQTITSSAPIETGWFPWIPNEPVSSEARIAIIPNSDNTAADTSDANFIIQQRSLSIIRPIGNEQFLATRADTIWWNCSYPTLLTIVLNRNGRIFNTPETLATNVNSLLGMYHWIPTLPATDSAFIQIIDQLSPTITGSLNPFRIRNAVVALTKPAVGDAFYFGVPDTIRWIGTSNLTGALNIEIQRIPGGPWVPLISSSENNGAYVWSPDGTESQFCRMRVRSLMNTAISDSNNFEFPVRYWSWSMQPYVARNPNRLTSVQESWSPAFPFDPGTAYKPPVEIIYTPQMGTRHNPDSVRVTYTPFSTDDLTDATTINRIWTIVPSSEEFEDATLKLRFTETQVPIGIPDPTTADPEFYSIKSEDEGMTWIYVPGGSFYHDPSAPTAFIYEIPGLDKFSTWTITNSGFQPEVSYPDGGENLIVGQTDTIRWGNSISGGNVTIELNREYPVGEWETLFASTPNDSAEAWVVTEPITSQARIRIVSDWFSTDGDTSTSNFTIKPTVDSSPKSLTSLTVLPDSTSMVLNWNRVDSTVSGLRMIIDGYKVYYSSTWNTATTLLSTLSNWRDTVYTDTNVCSGTTQRYYIVKAFMGASSTSVSRPLETARRSYLQPRYRSRFYKR